MSSAAADLDLIVLHQANIRIARGDKVLLCGFGSGFSWGAAIIQW